MPRVDTSYTFHLRVDSGLFKDNESTTEAKTNSGPCVHPLLFESPLFACKEQAQCPPKIFYNKIFIYITENSNYILRKNPETPKNSSFYLMPSSKQKNKN